MDCTLKNGYQVPRLVKIATMVLIRTMHKDNPLVFREVVRHCRSNKAQPPLSAVAIKYLFVRGFIEKGEREPSEAMKQVFRLAIEDDPQLRGEYVIRDPEIHPPWSPPKK